MAKKRKKKAKGEGSKVTGAPKAPIEETLPLPPAVERSGKKARRVFEEARAAATAEKADAKSASKTARAALERLYQRVGDHWERRREAPNRKRPAAVKPTPAALPTPAEQPTPAALPTPAGQAPSEPPVAEPPVAEPPVAEPPVAEPPVAEPPVAEAPVAEAPLADEPIADEPTAEPPARSDAAQPPARSDAAQLPARPRGERTAPTPRAAGRIDAGSSVVQLREVARHLEIPGRSRMSKDELVKALQEAGAIAKPR
jgi:hypothetical protein